MTKYNHLLPGDPIPPELDKQVGVQQVAEMFGVTTRRVQQFAKDGIIPPPTQHGKYHLLRTVHAYLDHLRGEVARKHGLELR